MDHQRFYDSPPPVPVLSHTSAVHIRHAGFPKICFNIIFPPTPRSSEQYLPFGLSDHNFEHRYRLHVRATCPTHLILLDLIILIG
jgi:hypothetical protein